MRSPVICWTLVLSLALPFGAVLAQPASAIPRQSSSSQPAGKRGKFANHIILSGAVFNERGFALPGAQLEVRRAGQKKIIAGDAANRSGEFWLHVPGGVEYELTAKAPGYEAQTVKIESGTGDRQDLSIRLKPVAGEKKK